MKIAVSSYSFSQAMRDGRMGILDVIPKAKELGYEGVEIVRGAQSDEAMAALAGVLRVQSKEMDMPIIAYMVGADFLKNGVDAEVARLRREAEIAALMGAPRMRHDASQGNDRDGNAVQFEDALPILADGYRQVTEFAAGLGIHTMIENHGFFAQDASRVKALVEAVGHKNFGWLVDIGNFLCADEDCAQAVTIAAPLAVHAHAKDFHYKARDQFIPGQGFFRTRDGNALRGSIIGHGIVDVPKCLSILRGAGYDGWLSVEFEGIEDCLMALAANIANLKSMLA